jgi:hypothetical protein
MQCVSGTIALPLTTLRGSQDGRFIRSGPCISLANGRSGPHVRLPDFDFPFLLYPPPRELREEERRT